MKEYLNQLIFGFYPYVVLGVFVTGNILRYKNRPESWHAGSTQFLSSKGMRLGNNLFHFSIIILFFSHLFGLLTAKGIYTQFITVETKQFLAMTLGGATGLICFIGMTILVIRRFTEDRVKAVKTKMDNFILLLIYVELIVGLLTIIVSAEHPKGTSMIALANWAQHIALFRVDAASFVLDQNIIFKIHLFLGMTLFLLFPFSSLVHIWSVPLGFLFRKNQQIVKKRG
jgi:nitrate reductase gamma subunit